MFRLRAAEPSDLPAVLGLVAQCGLLERGVAEAMAAMVVATAGEAVVGCAAVEHCGGSGLLRSVAVAPDYRSKGLGRALVEAALERAAAAQLAPIFLLTTSAAAFFARLGFEPAERPSAPLAIAESWEFRAGCPATATFMVRR